MIKLNNFSCKPFHFTWIVALLVAFSATAQDKFYYGKNGEKIVLNVATDKVLVKFSDKVDATKRTAWMSKYRALGSVIEKRSNEIMAYIQLENSTSRTQKDIDELLKTLNKDREVEYASPVFRLEGGEEISMTNKFIVRLPQESDYASLQAFVSRKGLTIERQFTFNKNIFVVKANKASAGTSLEMANEAYETGKFKYAQPDFVQFHLLSEANKEFLNSEAGKKEIAKVLETVTANNASTTAPTSTIFDPLFYLQYHHQNNGPIPGTSRMNGATPDADLDVVEAWAKTRGQGVAVAVLDEGVDRAHEDINMVKGYDAAFYAGITPNNRNGNPDMIPGDAAHGTNCAGLVAARANNRGVRGVAPFAEIYGVRIFAPSTSDEAILLAMEWAILNGADVISNSWGGGAFSAAEEEVFTYAYTHGRNGKGTVVLCAAGNSNSTSPMYPAAFDLNISVGGSTMCDTRHRPASAGGDCSDETWWGSNYGATVDIYTPCVALFSTDNSGTAGYSDGFGTLYPTPAPINSFSTPFPNYSWFNGTSGACPIAAGAAALVLSANPNLSALEVRYALESTTDKVGGYTYVSNPTLYPHGTRSFELGYGRVNADKAVDKAIDLATNPAFLIDFVVPTVACDASPYVLKPINRSTGAVSYYWEVNGYDKDGNYIYFNWSNSPNPSFNITQEGTYYVYLEIEDASSATKSLEKVTKVGFPGQRIANMRFFTNLESGTLPAKWERLDPDFDGYTWEFANVSAFGVGTKSLKLDNWNGYTYGYIDALELPGLDVSNFNADGAVDASKAKPVILTFDYAYAAYPLGSMIFSERLYITVRGDCMDFYDSFVLLNVDLRNLATRTPTTANFVPTASQWGTLMVDLTTIVEQMKYYGYADKAVFFSIAQEGNLGNNFYIDNIRLDDLMADFTASETNLCALGERVRFQDASSGNIVSRTWSFPGGVPSSTTGRVVNVTYNSFGKFGVGLSVTDADGFTNSIFLNNFVAVINSSISFPHTSVTTLNFETPAQRTNVPNTIVNGWKVFDAVNDPNDLLFSTARSAYGIGTAAAYFDNYLNTASIGTYDGWISYPIDVTNQKDLIFTVDYAYAPYGTLALGALANDGLIIALAFDCSNDDNLWNFKPIWEKYGMDLATRPPQTGAYIPSIAGTGHWQTIRIDLEPYIRQSGARTMKVALLNYNDYGNRLWVDNLNIGKCIPVTPTAASNLNFSNILMGSVSASWTRGSGNGVLVIAREGKFASSFGIAPGTALPPTGTWHYGKYELMPGHFLLHHGTGTSLTNVRGLQPGKEYSFAVIEYQTTSICGVVGNRFAAPVTKSVTTSKSIASNANMVSNTLTSANLSWTNGGGEGSLVIMRENKRITPIMNRFIKHGYNYATSSYFGWGENMFDDHMAMYAGSMNSMTVWRLKPNQDYGVAIIDFYTDADNKRIYHASDYNRYMFTTQARVSTNLAATVGTTTATLVTSAPGNGQRRLFIMGEGRIDKNIAFTNGMTYTASSVFGSGFHLGKGVYVVANTTGNTVTVTNLKPNTRYSFAVIDFDDYWGLGTYYYPEYERLDLRTASPARIGDNEEVSSFAEVLENDFVVYPNPSRGEVNFSFAAGNQKPIQLAIYNSVGALVYETATNDELNLMLDMSKFGKGMYIAKITVDGTAATKKFVIE